MQKSFTIEYIKKNCGCYTPEVLLEAYRKNNKEECYKTSDCSITIEEILDSGIDYLHKIWFIFHKVITNTGETRYFMNSLISDVKNTKDDRFNQWITWVEDSTSGWVLYFVYSCFGGGAGIPAGAYKEFKEIVLKSLKHFLKNS